ncbi:MFS transporter [Streptomyces kanasensis]|uniref:MFS transporter n=1 Tax=Streptomyces kanasensis TaxID=936756 RepID=UPI0037FDFA4E
MGRDGEDGGDDQDTREGRQGRDGGDRAAGGRRRGPGAAAAVSVALITVLTSLPLFLVGATSTLVNRELGWDAGDTGLLLAAYWLSSLSGAYLSRRVDTPVSAETTVGSAALVTAVGLSVAAWCGGWGLALGTALGGLVYGYTQPHTNSLLMQRCPPSAQGFAFGLKQAAIPASTLVGSLAVPALAVPYGWRAVFTASAVVCVAYALPGLVVRRRGAAGRRGPAAPAPPLRLNAHLIGLAVAGLCGAMVGNALGGFLIASGVHEGMALTWASLLAAAGSTTNIAVRLVAGIVVDRGRYAPRALLWQLYLAGAVGTLLLAVGGGPWVMTVGGLLAFGGGWGWAGLLHYVAGAAFPGRAARATAVTQMGVSLGGATGPMLFGLLVDHAGWGAAWLMLTAVGTVAAVVVRLLREPPDTAAPATAAAPPSTTHTRK